jgi:guanylate kinase
MNKLFLLDGVAGTGKSDLLDYVKVKRNDVNIIKKYTTRSPRDEFEKQNAKTDLVFLTDDEFSEKQKTGTIETYPYGGKQYGFEIDELEESLLENENTFLIIRNKGLINTLCSKYSTKVLVISVFIYSDRDLIEQRLRNEGYDDDAIHFRLERSESVWDDYVEFDDFNDVIILNNSNKAQFHQKINQLINHYKKYEKSNYLYINPTQRFRLIDPLVQCKPKMKKLLDKYPYEKNIFLMMKYRDNNYSFSRFIRDELSKRGYNCVIANDPEWNITDNVFNPIAALYCCKYGIALFDEPEIIRDKKGKIIETIHYNPNVAYELGMMHIQRKKCLILINSQIQKVPFDLLKDLHKVYSKEEEFNLFFQQWIESIKHD